MAKETEVILRTIAFQVKRANSLDEVVAAIEAMCDEDIIAYAEKKANEWRAKEARKNES